MTDPYLPVPDRPAVPAARDDGLLLGLGLAGLLSPVLPSVLAVAALVLARRALAEDRRARRAPSGQLVAGLVLGGVGTGFALLRLAGWVALALLLPDLPALLEASLTAVFGVE